MAYGTPGQPGQPGRPGHGQEGQPGYGSPHGYPRPAWVGEQQGQPYGPGQPAGGPPPGHHYRPGYEPPAQGQQSRRDRDAGPVTNDDRTWALMSYLGIFLISFLAPIVVLAVKGRRPFARHHAAQSLNLCVAIAACDFVFLLMFWVLGTIGLAGILAVGTGAMVALIIAARSVNRGEWYRLPTFVAWPLLPLR